MTEEQAGEAAVRFSFEGTNRAIERRAPQELARASAPSCNCREAVGLIEQALRLGETDGIELTIEQVVVNDVAGNTATTDAQYAPSRGR